MAYGMNAATGKVDWYRYDTIEKSFQRYEEEIVEEENNDIYFLLTIVFAGVCCIVGVFITFAVLAVFCLISSTESITCFCTLLYPIPAKTLC